MSETLYQIKRIHNGVTSMLYKPTADKQAVYARLRLLKEMTTAIAGLDVIDESADEFTASGMRDTYYYHIEEIPS